MIWDALLLVLTPSSKLRPRWKPWSCLSFGPSFGSRDGLSLLLMTLRKSVQVPFLIDARELTTSREGVGDTQRYPLRSWGEKRDKKRSAAQAGELACTDAGRAVLKERRIGFKLRK